MPDQNTATARAIAPPGSPVFSSSKKTAEPRAARTHFQLNLPWLLLTGVLLANLFITLLTINWMRSSRAQYHEQALVTTRNLAQILAENVETMITNMDSALLAVADEYAQQISAGAVDSKALGRYIDRRGEHLPFLDVLRISDAKGNILTGTRFTSNTRLNIATREYFITQRDNPNAGLVYSGPLQGILTGAWIYSFSRRVNTPSGEFAGIVFGSIMLDTYATELERIDVGKNGTVSLRNQNLELLARAPMIKNRGLEIGTQNISSRLMQVIRNGQQAASYDAVSTIDGIDRTISTRKVATRPLYVVVGLSPADYLENWRSQVYRTWGVDFAFMTISLLLSVMFYRFWKRHTASVEKLVAQESKFRIVADFAFEWEYWEGPNRELIHISPSCEQITGYRREEFLTNPELMRYIVHPGDRHEIERHYTEIVQNNDAHARFRIVRRDGAIRWIAHGCRAIFDEQGNFLGRRASNRDITEMVRLNEELQELARTDSLTGLPNRRVFIETAQAELERISRYGSVASVLLIDIDHFKHINDKLGHGIGDQALVALAHLLKNSARTSDLPARFGGEEFVFLLVNASLAEAALIAERLRVAAAQLVTPAADAECRFTVSIGVAQFGKDDRDWSVAVQKADTAMYQAKKAGRNRVVTFLPGEPEQMPEA